MPLRQVCSSPLHAFGNALGNSIVSRIDRSREQDQLQDLYEKTGTEYSIDALGNVVANSAATQRAAEALLRAGTDTEAALSLLGNEELRNVFRDTDAANAKIELNRSSFEAEVDALDSGITTYPYPELESAGLFPSGAAAGPNGTSGPWDSNNPIVDALRPVVGAASAIATLADEHPWLTSAGIVAVQGAIGGGGVGQVVTRLGKAALGEAVGYYQGRAQEYVADKVGTYLQNNTDLNGVSVSLLSEGAGFGVGAVMGAVLGIGVDGVKLSAVRVTQAQFRKNLFKHYNDVGLAVPDGKVFAHHILQKGEGFEAETKLAKTLGIDIWDAKTNGVLLPTKGSNSVIGHYDEGMHSNDYRRTVFNRLATIRDTVEPAQWQKQAQAELNKIRTEMMDGTFKINR